MMPRTPTRQKPPLAQSSPPCASGGITTPARLPAKAATTCKATAMFVARQFWALPRCQTPSLPTGLTQRSRSPTPWLIALCLPPALPNWNWCAHSEFTMPPP
ncbi:hypothetical protein GQR58_028998 [Nymphon striatum]|nr:hypothetical protein GQR58_028998 [Nymphon striatum]